MPFFMRFGALPLDALLLPRYKAYTVVHNQKLLAKHRNDRGNISFTFLCGPTNVRSGMWA